MLTLQLQQALLHYAASPKYTSTTIPSTMRYHPNILKLCFLIYPMRNRSTNRDMTKDTTVPVISSASSADVNSKPNFTTFSRLAPNITGIARKNVYSAATVLDTPMSSAPTIVAPEREVPGKTAASSWKTPMSSAVWYVIWDNFLIDSANGHISFNTPSLFQGIPFDNIRLTLKNGLVVHAEAGDKTGELNAILDTDPGARRLGEFAFGVNPAITRPMRNILFDEKISGSFHLTPGQAYHVADNGNQSRIHWDMVCIQTEAAGGGDIYLDGKLVRRNGLFTLPELAILNPSLS